MLSHLAEWKVGESEGDANCGTRTFKKDDQEISIFFMDPKIIAAEITISSRGVELERSTKK
jgi:hypothetical protein